MPRHPFFEKETKAGLFQPRIKFLETFSREAPNLFEYRVPRLTALDGTEGKASTGERPSRRREPAELSALDARMEAAALAFASDHTVQGLHILQSAVEPILSSSVSVEPSFRDSVLAAVTGLGQVSLDAEALGVRWQMSSGRNRAPWRASAHIMEAVAGILYAASLASPDPATVSDSLLTTGDDLQDVAQLLRFSILATPEWSAGRTLMPWRMFLAPAKPPEEESISAIVWMHQRSAEFMRRRRLGVTSITPRSCSPSLRQLVWVGPRPDGQWHGRDGSSRFLLCPCRRDHAERA
jgi:hypothetical protein